MEPLSHDALILDPRDSVTGRYFVRMACMIFVGLIYPQIPPHGMEPEGISGHLSIYFDCRLAKAKDFMDSFNVSVNAFIF